ncbi:MAG TPA: TIGR04283 family arsenosugar biosynthesis glycosyltransferase [Candidatus Acidoferrales bacterium]|nr:TIGR04283 family arsenosugar biosynthesis glycosyltransferase [Candidatus Acidoferrales bacterium]
MSLSVIVPVLNEASGLASTLRQTRQPGVREIIVVDGGSDDGTVDIAQPLADVVVAAPRGRASQMNEGARRARGDVLLFLHGDTVLPNGFARDVLAACTEPGVVGGRFDVRLEPSSRLLRLTAFLINLRSRLSRIATGDQAIFVHREVFERLGGYAAIPLMEDIDFSKRLKRIGRIACLRQQVITSSRRWRELGVVRTILLMWSLRFLYFCGVAPQTLKRAYSDARQSKRN